MRILYKYIATLGFVGYLPIAPGTFGSAVGFLLLLFLKIQDAGLLLTVLLLFIIGTFTAHHAEKQLGKDSGHIVVDELCGYMLSVLFIPKSIGFLAAAFILFRVFDIAKPPPAKRIELTVHGGAGVMLDDVIAGIYTNLCLQIWQFFGQAVWQ